MPTIDVCIATYKRPELLRRLLLSLVAQDTAGEFSFRIIVADNDRRRSAEAVAREFQANGVRIVYDVEPEQNVSLARNKSLALSQADYVATIDDDEYADPRWLLTLYRALTSHGADVVNGPILPEFPPGTPQSVRESRIFTRPNPPTGSTERYHLTTGNALFRRGLVAGTAAPFDRRFGRTGGEDTDFFRRLKASGCRAIWCREAHVFGPVPAERANLRWLLRRHFRIGNTRPRYHDDPRAHRATDLRRSSMKALRSSWRALMYAAGGVFHRRWRAHAIRRGLDGVQHLGVLAHYVGIHYEEYRDGADEGRYEPSDAPRRRG